MSTIWDMIAAEREDLAGFLSGLAPDDWDKTSMCPRWRIRDVAAHVISGAKETPPRFIGHMFAAGFNFEKLSAGGIARESQVPVSEYCGILKSLARAKSYPAGAILGEALVHGDDIRRALGKPAVHPVEHLTTLADTYKKAGAPLNNKKRIAGLSLQATDTDWSTGEGPQVSGPIMSLVLAMSGRKIGLEGLSGPGLDTLRVRLA
jgi:uncharacterized protein (TIGR03083 family)